MSITPNPEMEVSLDDEEAEHLIARTDALIHRHESFAAPSETDDLPVLTDVVDERIEPFIGDTAPIVLEPAFDEPAIGEPEMLDETPVIATETALPDDLAERLQATAASHLRATLLPLISTEIADTLDKGPEA